MFRESVEFAKTLPTGSDLHVNAALGNFAVAWKQETKRFAAGRAFGEVPVDKPSDQYYVWDEADFFRDEAEEKAPENDIPLMNLRISNTNYQCKVWHIGGLVSEMDIATQDAAVNKEEAITRAIVNKLLIRREAVFNETAMNTDGVWLGSTLPGGADLVGGTDFVQWDNYGASNPINDLRVQIAHLARLGIDPMEMKLVVGNAVWQKLVDHTKILERYENVMASIMNEQLIAAVLGIGEIIVPYAAATTSAEGAATKTIAYQSGKHAVLLYSPNRVSIDEPSAGKMFNWKFTGGQDGIRIRRWLDNEKGGWKIVGDSAFVPKITSAVCGVRFKNAIA